MVCDPMSGGRILIHETCTSLEPGSVIAAAKKFFSEQIPHNSAFPEKEGLNWMTLRGQGGEEIAIGIEAAEGKSRVRASTLFFDQAVARFLQTLPVAPR